MADLCEAQGVEYFHFIIPHAVDAERCNANNFINLIFNLACVFGVIKLNSIVIFGEFKGKNKLDELKLRFLDEKLYERFEKHLRICRRLMKLGIEA